MTNDICTTNTSEYVGKYIMTTQNMNRIVERMVDPSLIESIFGYFTGYDDNAVISIAVYPRNLYTDMYNDVYKSRNSGNDMPVSYNVKIVKTKTMAMGYKIDNNCQNTRFYAGSLVFEGKYNNFLDYTPYTSIEVYLPCVGVVGLDPCRIMNRTVDIYFVVDLETGQITYFLETVDDSGNSINVGQYSGQYGVQLALNSTNIADNRMSAITGTISGAIAAMTGSPIGIGQAASSILGGLTAPAGASTSNSGTGISNFYMDSRPYAIITRTRPIEPDNYGAAVGYPSKIYTSLKTLGGYNVIESIHLEGFEDATGQEREEIENLLKAGVILAGETDRYLDPREVEFTGAVGADPETVYIGLYNMDGEEIQISGASALNSAVGDNITTHIYSGDPEYGNKIAVTCNYKSTANSTGILRIRDTVNNYADLRIDFNISEGLSVNTDTYYIVYGAESTKITGYMGTITSISCDNSNITAVYDGENITITYNGTGATGTWTITVNGQDGETAYINVYIVYPAFQKYPETEYEYPAIGADITAVLTIYSYAEGYGSGNITITDSDSDITDGTGSITPQCVYNGDTITGVVYQIDGPINAGTASVTIYDTKTGESITKTLTIPETA